MYITAHSTGTETCIGAVRPSQRIAVESLHGVKSVKRVDGLNVRFGTEIKNLLVEGDMKNQLVEEDT